MASATLNRLGTSVEQLTSKIEGVERISSGNKTPLSEMMGRLNASSIAQWRLTDEMAEMKKRLNEEVRLSKKKGPLGKPSGPQLPRRTQGTTPSAE